MADMKEMIAIAPGLGIAKPIGRPLLGSRGRVVVPQGRERDLLALQHLAETAGERAARASSMRSAPSPDRGCPPSRRRSWRDGERREAEIRRGAGDADLALELGAPEIGPALGRLLHDLRVVGDAHQRIGRRHPEAAALLKKPRIDVGEVLEPALIAAGNIALALADQMGGSSLGMASKGE
jgi:hypothetical protein